MLNGWKNESLSAQIVLYSLILFACCMVCHGELARSKPGPRYLTSFYLTVAGGGAAAGLFVALLAPLLFNVFWEYQLGLWATALMVLLILMLEPDSWLRGRRFGLFALVVMSAILPGVTALAKPGNKPFLTLLPGCAVLAAVYVVMRWGDKAQNDAHRRALPMFCIALLVVLGGTLFVVQWQQIRGSVWSSRNFYGVLDVRGTNENYPEWQVYSLYNGRILHGLQYRAQDKRDIPTTYFSTVSGVGRALLGIRTSRLNATHGANLRIGVVGLGIGTLAAFGMPGDYIRFYEINPAVISIANDVQYFTYLKQCRAQLDVVTADARIGMERELAAERPQHFDMLAIDAFSGGSIPMHLLTEEAFRTYLREITPTGVLAVHVTNAHLDLTRVLSPIATELGLSYAFLHTNRDSERSTDSDWVLLSSDGAFLSSLLRPEEIQSSRPHESSHSRWTDDYSNLLGALRR